MGWLALVDIENKSVVCEIQIKNAFHINQIAYYGKQSSEFFLACYNGLYLAKLVTREGDERQLEVISETYKVERHITFVDMISENTFLLGIIGKNNKI